VSLGVKKRTIQAEQTVKTALARRAESPLKIDPDSTPGCTPESISNLPENKQVNVDVFSNPRNKSQTDEVLLAKLICGACVYRDECLDESLKEGYPVGIWGGLDESERRSLARARRHRSA
jgi:hypothetical protein